MELKEILAISGQPGLYKYVAQSTHGVIVESLLDGRRMNASATSKVSSLTEISMFTEGDDIPLADVFTKIYAHTGGREAVSPKEAPEKLKPVSPRCFPTMTVTGYMFPTSRSALRGTTSSSKPGLPNSSSRPKPNNP